ncbi:MAG: type II toxin-antitoxin system VapC family toxin [Chloroflexota bacterium]
MARKEVHDTSVLIQVIRDPDTYGRPFSQSLSSGRAWLSSVVVAELYAGTRSQEDAQAIDRIVATMKRAKRLLVPTHDDWACAARIIARCIRQQGSMVPRDHLADVLIAVSTGRQLGGTVVTANTKHFELWVEYCRAAGLDVIVSPYQG